MNDADQHDGEREVKDRDRRRPRSFSQEQPRPTAKLVPVKASGLSGPFIRRPVMTVLLTLSVIVAGLATYGKLAVNDLPAVDYPVIQVSCSYPGADPTTMANNIATPLEKQFLQIPGLDIITSTSTQSNTQFTLQFVLSKSITDAATDVQAAIQRATGKLPIDLPSPPTFTKTNPNDQAVYLLGLMSDTLTDGDLYKYASTVVAQRINILPGVSQVNIYGVQGAIRVKADPSALAARALSRCLRCPRFLRRKSRAPTPSLARRGYRGGHKSRKARGPVPFERCYHVLPRAQKKGCKRWRTRPVRWSFWSDQIGKGALSPGAGRGRGRDLAGDG